MRQPTVYVGIVSYNSRQDLPHCLQSLQLQTYPYVRIIIVDNSSDAETVHWLQLNAHIATCLYNSKNIGFSAAHNQIIQYIQPESDDYYMPLNPDVRLTPTYIEKLVSLQQETDAGWCTGKLLQLEADETFSTTIYSVGHALMRGGYAINIGFGLSEHLINCNNAREVFGAPATAVLIQMSMIEKLAKSDGLYDADMFMYYEDVDFDWRARRQGYKCWYTPHAIAYHRVSNPSQKLRAMALSNRYLSVIKNAYWVDILTYNLPLILLHIAVRSLISPRLGMMVFYRIISRIPKMLAKRSTSLISRKEMRHWFRWGKQQPTTQPSKLIDRLQDYLVNHFL